MALPSYLSDTQQTKGPHALCQQNGKREFQMAEFLLQWILKHGNKRSDGDDGGDDDDDEERIQAPMNEPMDDPIDEPKDDPSKSCQIVRHGEAACPFARPKTSVHLRAQRAVLHHVQVSQMGYTCSLYQPLPRISTLEALTST
jgi:hypothetical protein